MTNPNPFYYWYEFLMRSDEAKWSDYVKDHMTKCDTWVEWWEKHEYLFKEIPRDPVHLLKDGDRLDENDNEGINVVAYLHHPRQDLINAFTKLIDEYKDVKRGPPEWDHLGEYFSLTSKVDSRRIHTLEKTLNVYDEVKGKDESTYYLIGVKLGISPENVVKPQDEIANTAFVLKQNMTKTVSRYYQSAVDIIDRVERGFFPDEPKKKKPE